MTNTIVNDLTNYPKTIAFIGAGNMASAIFGGLIANGLPPERIIATTRSHESCERTRDNYGIRATTSNHNACDAADIVVLCVKPQNLAEVAKDIAAHLSPDALVISVAAGIDINALSRWLGENTPIVRCMPNTPSQIQQGACGLFANPQCSQQHKEDAEKILSSVGLAAWLESEQDIHAVTAVSASGPAYIFLVLEAMIDAGVSQGLSEELSKSLAIQTVLGAAALAQSSEIDPAELRKRVTSPGGTTEQAINKFESKNLRAIFSQAMEACANRSKQLAESASDH